MSKVIDLTGQQFGKLLVIERDFSKPKGVAYWKCQCECGNIISVSGSHLRTGHTKSCGCLVSKNLTGKIFGRLKVIAKDNNNSNKNNGTYWICECECGNTCSIQGRRLLSGQTKSCGCLRKEKAIEIHTVDLIGQKFCKLTVINKDTQKSGLGSGAYWICECECGGIKSVKGSDLLRGNVKSCGCLQSSGEFLLKQVLRNLSIEFEEQKKFPELVGKEKQLSFDFYLPLYNVLIECQGEQHCKEIPYYGGEKRYEKQKKYDKLKKEYCKKNHINLIEIFYFDYKKINEDYVKKMLEGYYAK